MNTLSGRLALLVDAVTLLGPEALTPLTPEQGGDE